MGDQARELSPESQEQVRTGFWDLQRIVECLPLGAEKGNASLSIRCRLRSCGLASAKRPSRADAFHVLDGLGLKRNVDTGRSVKMSASARVTSISA